MATVTFNATALRYTQPPTSSTWHERCYQGKYSGSDLKAGAMLFGKLRDGSINWSNQRILGITLTCTYDGAGSNSEKTLGIWLGTKNVISGSGESMRGTLVGNIPTNGKAYNATRSIFFNSATNSAAFAVLADWLVHGTTTTLAIYRNESDGGHSYSSNYLAIKAASLAVEYEPAGSFGDLSDDDVELGQSVTLNISPVDTTGSVTHTVRFSLGSRSATVMTKGSSLSKSYTIPNEWHDQIVGMEGLATCELITYINGVETATSVIPFTVRIPAAWSITLSSFSALRYSSHLDDRGRTVYENDLLGDHVWVGYSISAPYVSQSSSAPRPTLTITYTRTDDPSVTGNITRQITTATTTVSDDRTAFSGGYPVNYEYSFAAVVSNGHQSVRIVTTVSNGSPLVHMNKYGVAFGGFAHGTADLPLMESVFPAMLHNGLAVNGMIVDVTGASWVNLTPDAGVTTPATNNLGDGPLRYKRIGSLIVVHGGVTVAGGQTIVSHMPYAPVYAGRYILAPCSGYNIARLYINADGLFKCEWIRKMSDGSAYSGAIWVDCDFCYWIA